MFVFLLHLYYKYCNNVFRYDTPSRVQASFSHCGTLTKFLSALNLFNDGFVFGPEFRKERAWVSSRIMPYATNFAAVLYEWVLCYIICSALNASLVSNQTNLNVVNNVLLSTGTENIQNILM